MLHYNCRTCHDFSLLLDTTTQYSYVHYAGRLVTVAGVNKSYRWLVTVAGVIKSYRCAVARAVCIEACVYRL